MKQIYLLLLFILFNLIHSHGQVDGDFQSLSSGNWESVTSWEVYNSTTSSWEPATNYPGQALGSGTNTITILSGHTITISSILTTNEIGSVIVNGTLDLNPPNPFTITLATLHLFIDGGYLDFSGPQISLRLPLRDLPNPSPFIEIKNGGIIGGNCTPNDEILIGNNIYAACKTTGANDYVTFGEITASGGTINAVINMPPNSTSHCKDQVITLEGQYEGAAGSTVSYQWSAVDPNGNNITISSGTLSSNSDLATTPFTPDTFGNYLISFIVSTDINGINFSNTVTNLLTIEDNSVPSIVGLPGNIIENNTIGVCDKVVTWIAPTATDNCPGSTITQTAGPASGSAFPIGTTTITYTATDAATNSVSASFTISVSDTENPSIVGLPNNIITNNTPGVCDKVVTWTAPIATDNCSGSTITQTAGPASGSAFPIGITTITYTATDAAANSVSASFTITVSDTENPSIVGLPNNIITNNTPGVCNKVVTWITPTATDNCPGSTITQTAGPASGSAFPIGITTITYTATDAAANSVSASFTITVSDTEKPTITPPSAINTTTNSGCTATGVILGTPTTADNCSVASVTNNHPSTTYPLGTTTVVWTVTDNSGNTKTANQLVIIKDNIPPTISCPANMTVNTSLNGTGDCYTTVNVGTPITSDNCGVASVIAKVAGVTITTSTYQFPVGNTTITWTVKDNSGLTASCEQVITVIDNEKPAISCPGDQNVNYNNNCQYILQDYTSLATTSDNCDSNVTIIQNPAPGTIISATTTTVTLTATDDAGNSSNCTFSVTATDNTPPTAVCQNINAYLTSNGTVTISALSLDNGSSDNCGIVSRTVTPSSFNCSNVGINNVVFTVYDNNGNSASCNATVNVIDNTPPTVICKNFVVVIDAITRVATIKASDIDNGSNDACGIASLNVFPSVFADSPNLYTTTTTLTAVDNYGNSSSCTATVTVEPPKNQFTYLTGVIVNPVPDNPQPPSALVEVTACPDGITVPKDIQFTIQAIDTYDLQASNVLNWEYSNDNGETWIAIPNTAGLLTYTLTGLTSDTFVRLKLQETNEFGETIVKTSSEAYARFLPPDEPPIIISHSALDICFGDSVTVNAESFYDQSAGQFGKGGKFNYAQPDGWRVDGLDGYFPASGDNGSETTWKETNSNSNATFSGINYDTTDNSKFAIAHGEGNYTTLETPVFSTIGMTSSEAILSFYTSFYFCNGGHGEIWLSFDSGTSYPIQLNTNEGYDFDSSDGTTTSGVKLAKGSGNKCIGRTEPRKLPATLNLGPYAGLSGLRVMFKFYGSTSSCGSVSSSTIPNPDGVSCSTGNILASGWAIDDVGFAFAQVDDVLEWTDEDGNVITTGTTATVTPKTPGIREYGVTTLVNGCRTDNNLGTSFVNINTSLAYAGEDYNPLASNCGENTIHLNAYDNTKSAKTNYNKGAWISNLYEVPDTTNGDTDYPGTGITGTWTIVSASNTSCGNSATFSSANDPDAIFTADPGSYTLRWTLSNGCYDELSITLIDCKSVDFDGNNDYVSFKDNYNLNSNFSIETWVKPHSINTTRTVFSRKDSGDNTKGYDLSIVNGQVQFNWYNGASGNSITTGSYSIGTDRWYHLAVTFDGTTYILYVDGLELASKNGIVPAQTASTTEALLGAMYQSSASPVNHFHGWIDEVKIWNKSLDAEQIHQMMNQEIDALGTDIAGVIIPMRISGADTDNNGIEDNPVVWNDLLGYYRMDTNCGNLNAYKGVSGRLHNINTSEQQTAPIPYTSRVSNQTWDTDNTWTNYDVWNVPNSLGINSQPIDWNIVKINHKVTANSQDLTLLGLIVMSNELVITNSGAQDENNLGHGLWITHYLNLDGKIDLVGESQLVQKRYTSSQFSESILEETSTGYIERDQQGKRNSYNYNYWSSPVSNRGAANNSSYSMINILRDGTDSANHKAITFGDGAYFADGPLISPIKISNQWIYTYSSLTPNSNTHWENYWKWQYKSSTGLIAVADGFSMKGTGGTAPINANQNFVYTGKPNSGTINKFIALNQTYLVGNPYPSALDADEFIKDNLKDCTGCRGTENSFGGVIYFWDHFGLSNNHFLAQYEGGYATYTLTGGVAAVASSPLNVNNGATGTKVPQRYIPVGQAFFINAPANNVQGGTFSFKNSQRAFVREASGNSVFFKQTNDKNSYAAKETVDKRMKIRLGFDASIGIHRQILLGTDPNTTNKYDLGYDAVTLEIKDNDIYWELENSPLIIQGIPRIDSEQIIPFGFKISNEGETTIKIDALENIPNNLDIYIYDSVTKAYFDLRKANFNINLAPGEYNNRFSLQFLNKNYSINETNIGNGIVCFYTKENQLLNIKNYFTDATIKSVSLFNIAKQKIANWDMTDDEQNLIQIPINHVSAAVYIVLINTNKGEFSQKIIIK
jgi:large repetitive protein